MTPQISRKTDFNQLLKLRIRATFDAGNEILHFYNIGYDIEIKNDNSPLTNADKASHNVIAKALGSTNIPVLIGRGKIHFIRNKKELGILVDS